MAGLWPARLAATATSKGMTADPGLPPPHTHTHTHTHTHDPRLQEAERMNALLAEVRRSLAELALGLRGNLTMSEGMERLLAALADDRVPPSWEAAAWPSLRPLSSWVQDLGARCEQLAAWTADLAPPRSVWLSGLFNPQSFLTAVMQTTARRNDWPLDRTVIVTEVTKRTPDQIDAPSRDGAFVHGLTLEGARWDGALGQLEDSRPKELVCPMVGRVARVGWGRLLRCPPAPPTPPRPSPPLRATSRSCWCARCRRTRRRHAMCTPAPSTAPRAASARRCSPRSCVAGSPGPSGHRPAPRSSWTPTAEAAGGAGRERAVWRR